MDRQVERELALLRANRERAAGEMKRLDVEIGRVADVALAKHEYLSKSSIARLLGFPTHVSNLIEASRSASEPAGSPRIPLMENTVAGEYVTSVGARVIRSISAFHEGDVLVQSGLDPRLFTEDGRDSLDIPEMLWQLDNGEWIGVGMVSVGYAGTGPRLAQEALERAGVDASAAREIPRWRFCDALDVDDPTSWVCQTRWPVHARSTPRVSEDKIIVLFGDALDSLRAYHGMGSLEVAQPAVDESGFYPSAMEQSPLQAWLSFLDDIEHLPSGRRGPASPGCSATTTLPPKPGSRRHRRRASGLPRLAANPASSSSRAMCSCGGFTTVPATRPSISRRGLRHPRYRRGVSGESG